PCENKGSFERGNVVKTDWKQSPNAIFARRTATGSKRAARSRLLRPRFPDVMPFPQRSATSCRSCGRAALFKSKQDTLVAAYAI
ncbi:MAG: hypothetical protein WBL39_14945, partial [Terrimicrobiaceae bacterium]